jgi:CubicO group peptidase (beta-lactamase class C family)
MARGLAALCWLVAASVFAAPSADGGTPYVAAPLARFEPAVAGGLEAAIKSALVGYPAAVSVGVLHQGKGWFGAYGLADVANKRKATPKTSYRMASITKSFTAIAVLQLAERGKLSLDDEIQQTVPAFPRKSAPVTVRQLLSHQAGIFHYRGQPGEKVKGPVTTAQALALFDQWELACEPGTRFLYSSYGYNLLGAAIEGASGVSYADYLAANVFGPLGMKDSDIERPARANARWAVGYALRKGVMGKAAPLELSGRLAGGGTRSTVEDLIRYAQALLDGALLSPQSHRAMRTVQLTRDGTVTDYGLGFSVFPQRGHYVVTHAGGQAGTSTLLVTNPSEGFALAVATNLEGQGAVMTEISILVQELLLDRGARWRHAAAADPLDKLLHDGLSRIQSYGLARHSFLEASAPVRSEAELPRAFEQVNRLLSREALALPGARETLEQAHHPREGEPFVRVGVGMAGAIERAFGTPRLAEGRGKGPLAFFQDYLLACAQLECAAAVRFSPELQARLELLAAAWERSNAVAVRTLRIGPSPDVATLQAMLRPAFEAAPVWPDLSVELARAGLRDAVGGRIKRGRELLQLAGELYPGSVGVQLAQADLEVLASNVLAARAVLEPLTKNAEAAVTPAVLEQRADRLRGWGKVDAAQRLRNLSEELFAVRAPTVVPAPPSE